MNQHILIKANTYTVNNNPFICKNKIITIYDILELEKSTLMQWQEFQAVGLLTCTLFWRL